MSELDSTNVPYGFCQCGCGLKTKVAPHTDRTHGWIKGEPKRYISGHNRRSPGFYGLTLTSLDYVEEDRGHTTSCWVWRGSLCQGYGYSTFKGKSVGVHRIYYESAKGPIPKGLEVDHLCRVRSCINPDHLEVVTRAINTQRGNSAKLDMSKANAIRRLRQSGLGYAAIAERYGVDPTLIGYIVRGEIWVE